MNNKIYNIDASTFNELKEHPYPYNMIILLENNFGNKDVELTRKGFIKLINENLTDKQIQIFELRYRDFLTLEEIGKVVNLSRERVRTICNEVLRKISNIRDFDRYYSISYGEYVRVKDERDEIKSKLDYVLTKADIKINNDDNERVNNQEIYIGNIEFSTRTYNALMRAGIKTLYDISIIDQRRFYRMNGFGKKTYNEIINKMHEYGYKMAWEK